MTLELDAIERTFPEFTVGPVTLAVGEEVVSVLGPSGCGKTTVLSIVAGLTTPTNGRVQLGERDVTATPPESRGVAMVFQDGALFPHLSARQNIAYAAENPDRVESLATTLEITPVLDRDPASLSGGERQRVALARAIAADPAALVLDEPLANLDAPIRARLRPIVRTVLQTVDIPVIHVTHDQRAAATIGDRIAVMHDGHIDHVGTAETVFVRPATPFVAEFIGATVIPTTVTARDGDHVLDWGPTTLMQAPPGADPGSRVRVAVQPHALAIHSTHHPPASATSVRGRVSNRVFEGDRYRFTVTVPDTDHQLDVETGPDPLSVPGVGDTVDVTIPATAVHVVEPSSATDDAGP